MHIANRLFVVGLLSLGSLTAATIPDAFSVSIDFGPQLTSCTSAQTGDQSNPQTLQAACTDPSANVTGVGTAGDLFLKSHLDSTGNQTLSESVTAFSRSLFLNNVPNAYFTSGVEVEFLWTEIGLISADTPTDQIRLELTSSIDNQQVLDYSDKFSGPLPPTVFSRVASSTPIVVSPTTSFLIDLSFTNSVTTLHHAESNFGDTISLQEILILDPATGKPIDGVTITDGGHDIPTNQQITPEPHSILLMAGGLAAVLFRRRIRQTIA